jgi:hypothetical protein
MACFRSRPEVLVRRPLEPTRSAAQMPREARLSSSGPVTTASEAGGGRGNTTPGIQDDRPTCDGRSRGGEQGRGELVKMQQRLVEYCRVPRAIVLLALS